MVLSTRERYIAIGVAAAAGLLLLDQFVLKPYDATAKQLAADSDRVTKQLNDNADLKLQRNKLRKVWDEMKRGGLKSDGSAADTQVYSALLDWSQNSRMNVSSIRPDRPTTEGNFEVRGYHVTATGTMSSVSRMLWAIESATIPVRVSNIQLISTKDATDDLSLQMDVSTLCELGEPGVPLKPGAAATVPTTRHGDEEDGQ